jgi:hypothetical protein
MTAIYPERATGDDLKLALMKLAAEHPAAQHPMLVLAVFLELTLSLTLTQIGSGAREWWVAAFDDVAKQLLTTEPAGRA